MASAPNRGKIREKTANAINMNFFKCYQNPLGQQSKEFSKLQQFWGLVT